MLNPKLIVPTNCNNLSAGDTVTSEEIINSDGSITVFHQLSNDTNWTEALNSTDNIDVDVSVGSLIKEMILTEIEDKIIDAIVKVYENSPDAARKSVVFDFLQHHKGKMVFYKEFTF